MHSSAKRAVRVEKFRMSVVGDVDVRASPCAATRLARFDEGIIATLDGRSDNLNPPFPTLDRVPRLTKSSPGSNLSRVPESFQIVVSKSIASFDSSHLGDEITTSRARTERRRRRQNAPRASDGGVSRVYTIVKAGRAREINDGRGGDENARARTRTRRDG